MNHCEDLGIRSDGGMRGNQRSADSVRFGVPGHVVSMRGPGNAPTRPDGTPQTVAICECGWSNALPWPSYAEQDAAIAAHWRSVRGGRRSAEG